MDDKKPSKCCGCIPLKHATITIGVLESFLGFIGFVIAIRALPAYPALFICMAVVCASHIAFANLLVIGATSGRPALLLPWLTLRIISLIAMLLLFFVAIFHLGDVIIILLSSASLIIDSSLSAAVLGYRQELLETDITTQTEESP